MKSTNFSIIIPNLNGAKLLPVCFKSLILSIKKYSSASTSPQSKFEIILVDNASTDNSISLAKKIYPKVKIIKNNKNIGFAKAINQGADLAKHNWIIPCNNDIKFHPQWFSRIIKTIQNNKNPQIVTYFGTILNKTGDHIESVGLNYSYSGKCQNINNGKKINQTITQQPSKTIWGGNAGLIVYQKKIFQSLGGFDTDFFAYLEDVDFNLRLDKAGHQTILVPTAISYHSGGTTSQKLGNLRHQKTVQNWLYIIIKNYSLKQIWQNFPGIIEQRFRNLSGLLKNTLFLLWLPTTISIYGQVIINLPIMLVKRKQIKINP